MINHKCMALRREITFVNQEARIYYRSAVGAWKFIVAILLLGFFQAAQADLDSGREAYKSQDYEAALKEFMPLAKKGEIHAEYYMGLMYANGYGLSQDPEKAKEWFEKFCKQYESPMDARFNLGVMYFQGKGVPQNYEEAINWFKKAAEGGDSQAQYNLGLFYDNGEYGLPQDREEAAKWYRQAANQGMLSAQNRLGILYAEGRGITRDYVQSYFWFNTAAELGDESAAKSRGIVAKNMSPSQIVEAKRLTHEWLGKVTAKDAN